MTEMTTIHEYVDTDLNNDVEDADQHNAEEWRAALLTVGQYDPDYGGRINADTPVDLAAVQFWAQCVDFDD